MVLVCPCTAARAETSEVIANVSPIYKFSLPSNTSIPYGQCETLLGQFGIDDLLLYDGESLTIELIAGPLRHESFTSVTLPYAVRFAPPAKIRDANIGDAYDVRVLIGASDFASALSGSYRGTLTFNVRSSYTGGVIFTGSANITVRKPGAEPPGEIRTITVYIYGEPNGGKVLYGGRQIQSGAVIPVAYGGSAAFSIKPESGFAVERVLLNGEDVSDKLWSNGWLIISKIYYDCELEITFAKSAAPPKTGDDSRPICFILLWIAAALIAAFAIWLERRHRKNKE